MNDEKKKANRRLSTKLAVVALGMTCVIITSVIDGRTDTFQLAIEGDTESTNNAARRTFTGKPAPKKR